MANKLFFLADLHLCPEHPERADAFIQFLHRHAPEAHAIYIVGDLFDYWVGAKQCRIPAWEEPLAAIEPFTRQGLRIAVIGGNRDYLLDPPSLEPYGLQSLGMEHCFRHDGHRICIVHGHMQFPDPWHSKLFLRFIQSRAMRAAARTVPLWASTSVAGALRRWRRLIVGSKDPERAERYDPAAFRPYFDAGAQVVICGHNHWAHDYTEALARPGCQLLAVGGWVHGPTWLEYAQGTFRLLQP